MRLKILALALVALLALTAVAIGKTNKLKGKVRSDKNSSVSLKVVTNKNGVPKKVRSFTIKKVDYVCDKGRTGEVSAKLGNMRIGNFPLAGYLATKRKTVKGVEYSVSASISDNGRKVVRGTVYLGFTNGADEDDSCVQKKADFTAKVR